MNLLLDLFNTFGSRAIAAGVASAAAFTSKHFGLVVDPAALTSLGLGVYGIVHALVDKVRQPKPAAQPAATT